MQSLPDENIVKFHPDTLITVRKQFGLNNKERLENSLKLLEDWLKKQEHFTKKDFDREYLERMLISAKGLVERTKERLERTCTFRSLVPKFFEDFDVKEKTKICHGNVHFVAFPQLTNEHVRYTLLSCPGGNVTSEMISYSCRLGVMALEYLRTYDYASSYEYTIDLRFVKLTELLAAANLVDLSHVVAIATEGYGFRMKGIHVIIDSIFTELVLSVAKQVVPKKLRDRLHLHKDLDSLHKALQKDIMPIDLGGNEKSSADLYVEWVNVLDSKQFREYWKDMSNARTDETKRSTDKYNDQYLGMPGSFRNLSVD